MSHAHGAEGIKRAVRAGVRSIDHGTYLDEEGIALMLERAPGSCRRYRGRTTEALANDPKIPEPVREKLAAGRPELDAFRRAAEAGVKVAMGTDCPVAPHGTNLASCADGRKRPDPAQALVAATSSAAELMGLQDELGTLEPASAPTWSWSTATRSSSRRCASASSRSGRTAHAGVGGRRAAPRRPAAPSAPRRPSSPSRRSGPS